MLSPLLQLALVVALGIGAQWLAARVRAPSILFLLITGWIAGPMLGWIKPDELMGELLLPVVALSVGIILFEGGMSLKRHELAVMGSVTWRLVTMGAAVTWVLVTLSAVYVLQASWPVSLLLGAILVVTGPTVIGPLLRHIRPTPQAASVLKWEGIVIDPIGALLAVLVFESIVRGAMDPGSIALSVLMTLLAGGLLGVGGAFFLLFSLRRFWIPDELQSAVALATVMLVFAVANTVQSEAGLLATTVMGIIVANQRQVVLHQVVVFKENLRVLLLSILFILLSARTAFDYSTVLNWRAFAFVAVLVLVVRPLSVWVSTVGSKMPRNERLLLAWMAPRGIVAAAITSVFAFAMQEAGYQDAEVMVPTVFLVIAVTVALYGLTSAPLARYLKVTQPDPRGLLIAGAQRFSRDLASCLADAGIDTLLVDRNTVNVRAARLAGLKTQFGDILDHNLIDESVARGLGKLLALTPNDEVNCLAAVHFAEVMQHKNTYQLAQTKSPEKNPRVAVLPRHLMGRVLFREGLTLTRIEELMAQGYRIKMTPLTPAFQYPDYLSQYGGEVIPLIAVLEGGEVRILTAEEPVELPGISRIIGLVPAAITGEAPPVAS